MVIDTKICLAPEEMENIMNHPVITAACKMMHGNMEYSAEAGNVCREVLECLYGHSAVACVFGLLDALGVVIANVYREIEKPELTIVKGGLTTNG